MVEKLSIEEQAAKDVARWHERISVSKKWKDKQEEEGGWKRFIDEYEGTYDEVKLGNIVIPPINEVYAYVQSCIALLFARNPYLTANAKKTGTVQGAYILEAALNHYWKELKIKEEVESEIVDAILVGHAWNKTGLDVKLSGSGDLLRAESDTMFSNRISWKDIFFNIGSMNPPKDCRWIAHRVYMPVETIKKMYGAPAATIEGSPLPAVKDDYNSMLFKDDVAYGCVYEIFSASDRMIYTIADGVTNKYMTAPRPWPDHWDEYQFDLLQFNRLNDKPYGLSDIAPWEALVLEKIKVFTMALNHVKRFNRQMLFKSGTISEEELDKFEKGIDGTALEVTGDPNAMTRVLDYGSLPPDIYLIMDRLDANKRNVNGMPETLQGGQLKTQSRTLGELESIQGGALGRIQRKIDCIEAHIENIARKLMGNIMKQFPVETYVKITGQEPQEIIQAFEAEGRFDPVSQTIRFTSDDIKGEYDISVKAGSTLPLDKTTRDKILDRLIELAIPLAQAPSIPPFLEKLIEERLRAYDIVSLEDAFKQQQAAIEQNKQQEAEAQNVESEKVLAETAKRNAQAEQITTETDIARATGMAKATGLMPMEAKV